MVIDMGQHVVQDYAQPLTLNQIMVPGLEDRARTFPCLSSAKQLSPGGVTAWLNIACTSCIPVDQREAQYTSS